jgi:hypothetical protein
MLGRSFNMTKCDFCIYFEPMKGCYWDFQDNRKKKCEIAIQRLEKALTTIGTVNMLRPMFFQEKERKE